MKITKISPLTLKQNSMEIDVTQDQLELWRAGALIQDVMPNLNPVEREFIMTGYTAEDWQYMVGDEDD